MGVSTMADSKIEWTDKTWNPVAGCTIVSPGCTTGCSKQQATDNMEEAEG